MHNQNQRTKKIKEKHLAIELKWYDTNVFRSTYLYRGIFLDVLKTSSEPSKCTVRCIGGRQFLKYTHGVSKDSQWRVLYVNINNHKYMKYHTNGFR